MNKQMMIGLLAASSFVFSCNQASQHVKDEANKVVSQTSDEVKKVIGDLGLVYVEEGSQSVITYDEVNAAQQAWCDA